MLRLRPRFTSSIPLEAPSLRPDALASLDNTAIKLLPIQHGNRTITLGEVFEIDGDASDAHIQIVGDVANIKWLGAGMSAGRLEIDGAAGWHLGSGMQGGEIIVHGDAGDWAGAEMSGGRLTIMGNAGNALGAGYRGARHGMKGGTILVHGNAGHEVGATMRRGLIAIAGRTGDYAGVSMIAGNLFLFGPVGQRAGAGLKRGSIVCFDDMVLSPTFVYDCRIEPVFVALFLRQLRSWGFPVPDGSFVNCDRYSGDRIAIGKGEILLCRKPS